MNAVDADSFALDDRVAQSADERDDSSFVGGVVETANVDIDGCVVDDGTSGLHVG